MFPFSVQVVGALVCALLAATALRRKWLLFTSRKNGLRVPPGPPPRFLFANLFDIPSKDAHLAYTQMADKYGPIMQLSTPTSTVVVISSSKIARDILEKHGGISSDRPLLCMAKLAGWSWSIATMGNGPELRARRKVMHQYLNQKTISRYHSLVTDVARKFARSLLDSPNDFFDHATHATGAATMQITYGIEIKEENDPFVKIAREAMRSFGAVIREGVWAVDWMPILKHVPSWAPGASFKRFAKEQVKHADNMRNAAFTWTEKEMVKGTCPPCIVSECLSESSGDDTDNVVKDAAGMVYLGGVDTAAVVIQCFFFVMMTNPVVQRAIQDELDRVVGQDRLPTFSDRSSLPYVEATVFELLRMYPPTPLVFPAHALAGDLVYEGMSLRKGALFITNIWKILRDPDTYPDPNTFIPERFLKDGQIDRSVPDPREHVFGYGRRVCPGEHLADTILFIVFATILSCFDISKKRDDGVEIEPSLEFYHSLLSIPLPFPCSIRPRTESVTRLIPLVLNMGV